MSKRKKGSYAFTYGVPSAWVNTYSFLLMRIRVDGVYLSTFLIYFGGARQSATRNYRLTKKSVIRK